MPITQNPKECGWFYHAPAKKNEGAERMEYPAPSQIPGIGYEDPSAFAPQQVNEVLFKDTDSKYIRMAKLGGRKDLLQFNPEVYSKKSEDPVGYARNDWFYLEDNRMEDQEKKDEEKKQWDFLLPEYMVHKGYQPSFEDPRTPPSRGKKAPFFTEKLTEAETEEREGRSATDKLRVKIPETRKPGFGVRNERPPQASQKPPPREKPTMVNHGRGNRNMPMSSEKDNPTNMMKLLSGEYEREWHTNHDSIEREDRQAKAQKAENQAFYSSSNKHSATLKSAASQNAKVKEETEKEMFKLSRFQNIPSKIDSHQRKEIMAAAK